LDATVDIVGHARFKITIDGSTKDARPLPVPKFVVDDASVKALAVVTRIMISSAALSNIGDSVRFSPVDPIESARSTIASKHAMDARANAMSDVCC